jgi:hypothetical protein
MGLMHPPLKPTLNPTTTKIKPQEGANTIKGVRHTKVKIIFPRIACDV